MNSETDAHQTVLDFIKSIDSSQNKRENDKKMFEFFRQTENIKGLIDVICCEEDYFYTKKITSFLESSDTSVTENFVTKLEIAEYAFLKLSQHLNYPLAMGIMISNIFNRCVSVVPEAASDCFRRSSKVVPLIIEMFSHPAFQQIAIDEAMITQYKGIPFLMYGLLRALMGKKIEKLQDYIPDYFKLFPDLGYEVPDSITPVQFDSISKTLRTYMQNVMVGGEMPFERGLNCKKMGAFIRQYIKLELSEDDVDKYKLTLFDLALDFSEDEDLERLALKFVSEAITSKSISRSPIEYLAKYNSGVTYRDVADLFKLTAEKAPINIVLCLLIDLFKKIFERTEDAEFINQIAEIVKATWDKSDRKMKTFFIVVVDAFDKEISTKAMGANFMENVVAPYFCKEEHSTVVPNFNLSSEDFI